MSKRFYINRDTESAIKKKRFLLTLLGFILPIYAAFPQPSSDLALARSYADQAMHNQAIKAYKRALLQKQYERSVHVEYVKFLLSIGRSNTAKGYLKERIRRSPDNVSYWVDSAVVSSQIDQKSNRSLRKINSYLVDHPNEVDLVVHRVLQYDSTQWVVDIYKKLSSSYPKNASYYYELGLLYSSMGKKGPMLRFLLQSVSLDPNYVERVQGYLSPFLFREGYRKSIENEIMKALGENSNKKSLFSMIFWFYTRLADSSSVLKWFKIAQKRNLLLPEDIITAGKNAFLNDDFSGSISLFTYLKDHYPFHAEQAFYYILSSNEALMLGEEYVDQQTLEKLDEAYRDFVKKYTNSSRSFEVIRKRARLFSFYHNDNHQARALLQQIINEKRAPPETAAGAMLDLGDLLLREGRFWEASLAYFKVEKRYKHIIAAQDARLRNAKAMYYAANFCLSLSFFDVLRQATFKEIANDALYWSHFIRANMRDDCKTPDTLVQKMAKVHWLLFSRAYEKAKEQLEELILLAKDHPMQDDIHYTLIQQYIRGAQWTKAQSLMDQLLAFCGDDLREKCVLLQAELLEKSGGRTEEIERIYLTFLTDYPDSPSLPAVRRSLGLLR